jgi:phage terminase large subunit-like protein
LITHPFIEEYIQMYERGEIILNKERILLIEHLKKNVLSRDDIYFNEDLIDNYVRFTEKQYFILEPFQKFIIPFVFLYFKEDDELFYEQIFIMMARGAGKNGLITSLSHFFISPMHNIPNYDVSVVANSEEQSKVSFKEMYECIQNNNLFKWFDATKMQITGVDTNSVFRFRTSNASTKDGGRDGAVIYDELHRYENADTVNVFSSGLGKIKNPREFFITTDGFVRDGYLDKMKSRAMDILEGREPDDRLFPFICKLDDVNDMNDFKNWEMANPMFHKPMGAYAQRLWNKVHTQYKQLETNPTAREEFITKRMNLPLVDLEKSVATWEEIEATNQEIPYDALLGRECIGCIDFASIRDFASVGLLFRYQSKYVFITHSFVRKEVADKYYGYSMRYDNEQKKRKFAPIREWEELGLLTVVDEPSISPSLLVDWLVDARSKYEITKIIADNFRLELLRKPLEDMDFEVEIIRNPRAIHSLLAPRIETAFATNEIVFGSNPLMRWYTNNVLVKIDKNGNKTYEKKEPIRRKTDGFHAFVHGMYRADEISETTFDDSLDLLSSLNF